MVDINQDGWLDIYVCVASKFGPTQSQNYFFINQGADAPGEHVTFVDQADQYGLADSGYSIQAAYYDRDGDLDMYLLTNGLEEFSQNNARPKKTQGEGLSNDKFYRNDTPPDRSDRITFTNVTREAGILTEGYGLGITVNDINLDGWPDVYVANDFITNDLLWINNGDGPSGHPTFTVRDMPLIAQTAPVHRMVTDDLNGDDHLDVLMVGNSYAPDAHVGRYDAFIGQALLDDGTGQFRPLTLGESGFHVDTDAKDIIQLNRNGKPAWVVASNNDSLRVFAPVLAKAHPPAVANK